MNFKWLVFFFCLAVGFSACAQDTTKTIDRVITTKGKVYEGHITDDQKGDYLIIETGHNITRTIQYRDIAKIQYQINNSGDADADKGDSEVLTKKNDNNGLVTFDGYRASSHVTGKIVKKRNTGIVLTVIGMGLLGGGIALAASTPVQSTSNGYGGTVSSPGLGTLAGIAMIVGGVGVTIPGAVLWGGNAAKIRRAQRE